MSLVYDTIVIGLGSAGTTAASTLARAGKKVLALEAQDRVGGRVYTVTFGGGTVELGAEWIHGTEECSVYDVAVQNSISMIQETVDFEVYRSDGAPSNHDMLRELINYCLAFTQQSEEPAMIGDHMTRELKEYLKNEYPDVLKDEEFVQELLQLLNLIINNYMASNDWNDVSAQSPYKKLGGHQHMSWNVHGYKTFFEILLNTYNNGPGWPTLKIELNKEVSSIRWPKDTIGEVVVVCKDGTTYTANNVIVTVSLGVLKERHSTLFDPPLPQEKVHSIDNISIGVMDKVVLEFDKPVLTNTKFLAFMWKTEDRQKVDREDYWVTKIFGCSKPCGAKNALTFWTSGESGKLNKKANEHTGYNVITAAHDLNRGLPIFKVETLPEDVVKRKLMEMFRMFMGSNMEIQEPIGMIRSTWYSNPYTRGSYSYENHLVHEFPNLRADLGEPLRDAAGTPRVLFAGEATDLTHFATVHGASDSGYREAMRLLNSSKD